MEISEIAESVEYIRTRTSHRFKFNYTQIRIVEVEQFVSSPVFHALGHDWVIDYYPKASRINRFIYTRIDHWSCELICSIDDSEKFSQGVPKSFNLQSQIEKLLESSETADVTIVVENHSFRSHRSILAARSPVLKAELYGNMVEATQKQIKIKDICPKVFKAMLHFMYTDSFPCCDSETVSAEMAQHLFVAADRYAIEGLKALCEDKLCDSISLDSVSSTLALAEQHNSPRLKNSCLEFIAEPGIMLSWMSSCQLMNM
ncbi:hypothetical protein LUZ63_005238 [Rhynchospora breviuscula]|uniref:BTB domain-containing protein n=1 Tax=Rhynchospora breviuscula TaxID=2022672 RepID=A0A9Q0CMJ4_9POAL|nr:hypothetical protein LUZ63_005238 [Rhynchospora breviuscula]